MKRVIRLTESDLHKIVKNSVKRIISENYIDMDDEFFTVEPEYDIESVLNNIIFSDDNELMDIINDKSDLTDPSLYASDNSDGFSEVEWVKNAAKDEYMKRNKDYAFKNSKLPGKKDDWENYYEKNNYNELKGGNKNINNRIKNPSDYDDAETERFNQDYPGVFDDDGKINKKGIYNLGKKVNPNLTKSERNKMANMDKQPMHRKGSLNRSVPESKERLISRAVRESINRLKR